MLVSTNKLRGLEERISALENWKHKVVGDPVLVIVNGDRPEEEQAAALAAAAGAHPGRELHVIRMTVKPAPVLPDVPAFRDGHKVPD